MLKEKYPNFYMFWEIKNDRYTGRLLAGTLVNKEDIDDFISELLKSEEFMEFEDIKEEIEPTET
jgi:transcription termination factor NusB